jgi:hypothetical protein
MDEKVTGDSLVANSNNYESLTKIYETMRSRKTKSAYRRHLMRNMTEDSTWFYLNKQAAFANVTVLCDEADESPKFKASRPLAFNADTMVDLPEPGMPVRQTISFAKMKLFTNSSL